MKVISNSFISSNMSNILGEFRHSTSGMNGVDKSTSFEERRNKKGDVRRA